MQYYYPIYTPYTELSNFLLNVFFWFNLQLYIAFSCHILLASSNLGQFFSVFVFQIHEIFEEYLY